jgi:hypothetical protein
MVWQFYVRTLPKHFTRISTSNFYTLWFFLMAETKLNKAALKDGSKCESVRYSVLPSYYFNAAELWYHGENKISCNQWIILKLSNEFLQ